jgi:hypothetical protein
MDEEHQREYGQYLHENKENKELDLRKIRMVSEAAESILEDDSGFKQYGRFTPFSGTVSGQSLLHAGKT